MLSKKIYKNLIGVIEYNHKKKLIFFFSFVLIIMILETFSIGMFYPFLQSISNNEINPFINKLITSLNEYLGLTINTQITSLLIFSFLILIKNLFSYFFSYWQISFLRDLKLDLKNKILKTRFLDDYEKIMNIKQSTYIRDFNSSIEHFIKSINNTMFLIIEFFVFIGVVILLIFLQSSQLIYFAFIISALAFIFSFFVKKLLKNYGLKSLNLQQMTLGKLLDILNSTKEIILFKKSSIFIKQFKRLEFNYLNIIRTVQLIQNFPKHFFEILIVLGFTTYIIISSNNNTNLLQIIPDLGIIFLAIMRIMPALTKILIYLNKLEFAEIATKKISDNIKTYNKISGEKQKIENIENFKEKFVMENISFSYKNREGYVLEGLNLTVNKNDFIGIFGSSGAGKSTLIDLFCGLLKPTSGKIVIDEKEYDNLYKTNWLDKIGYLSQQNNLIDDTILVNITLEFNKEKIDYDLLKDCCDSSGLNNLIDKLPQGYESLVGEKGHSISGGEKQRIGIARSLYAKKEILIFDESTSSLDEKNKIKIINTIQSLASKNTIILVTHDLDVLKFCKTKFELKNKQLKIST